MKDINATVLEIVNYIVNKHPDFASTIEGFAQKVQGINNLDLKFLSELNKEILLKSKSQLRQDIFVLNELDYKRNGYFVEFGGTNGLDLSNSYLLESEYGWSGIVAEPGKKWHNELFDNRKCIIDTRCVWNVSNERLLFNQTDMGELSTIDIYSNSDGHASAREEGEKYFVDTISLLDLLIHYNAPREIDYLSIDTEGSEFEILNAFDFNSYKFRVITCEHNHTENREKINFLLTSNGYKRKFENISYFDDWYVFNG